ncbi:MAG TPA: hypothetical protein VHL78_00540 [Actinomycetota bacterium]|nr:hypothetical protein [Actinomycetota bacterium]
MGSDQHELTFGPGVPRQTERRRLVRGAVALALVAATACGGGTVDGPARRPSPRAAPTTAQPQPGPTQPEPGPARCVDRTVGPAVVRLRQVDDAFQPPCLIVLGGQFLRITNAGTKTHNFSVEGTDVDVDIDSSSHLTTEAVGELAPEGEATFFCKYHRDLGMEGRLRVTVAG